MATPTMIPIESPRYRAMWIVLGIYYRIWKMIKTFLRSKESTREDAETGRQRRLTLLSAVE